VSFSTATPDYVNHHVRAYETISQTSQITSARQDLSHAQPQRASSNVQVCEEGASEVLAVQIDFVLA
jgi:hypothetical protein